MILRIDETLRRRISWAIALLACLSYVGLGAAQEGARSSTLQSPPTSPLPFARHRVFGIDLQGFSSLEAREWLAASGGGAALVVVPLDSDVVEALASDESREPAIAAVDSIVQVAGGSPLAICLRPPTEATEQEAATAITEMLIARYPTQVLYVSACDNSADGWHEAVAAAVGTDTTVSDLSSALIPLSSGDPLHVYRLGNPEELTTSRLQLLTAPGYALATVDVGEAVDPELAQRATDVLRDSPQLALVLLRPAAAVEPGSFTRSIRDVALTGDMLPEGFTGITNAPVTNDGQWQSAIVGARQYIESSTDAAFSVDFVGTDVYLFGLQAPDAGRLQVWVDPENGGTDAALATTIDLEGEQAQDALFPIAEGLPAARHTIVVQAINDDGTTVMISGLFIIGKPAPAWSSALASFALAAVAVLAVAERSYSSGLAIRRRLRPQGRFIPTGHPRVFSRHR